MTKPARNYQTKITASTEGLDDLFGAKSLSSETVAGPSRDEDAGPSRDTSRYISAQQASVILGINKPRISLLGPKSSPTDLEISRTSQVLKLVRLLWQPFELTISFCKHNSSSRNGMKLASVAEWLTGAQ